MIAHIVLFRLVDRSPESVRRAAEVLRGLAEKVPSLRSLEAYRVHPDHQAVVKYMNSVRESAASVDYEAP